jgi:GNAT superfamily N-acetyltransferase
MIIRDVINYDFQEWLLLWEAYNSFYKRSVSLEVTETTWKRFLNPNEPVCALVAELDGKLLGFTAYLFHRHTALPNNVCYLQDLFTDKTARGKGVGKSLILAVSERAKDSGSSQVYWMTHETNAEARALYDKVAKYSGFIVYGKRA